MRTKRYQPLISLFTFAILPSLIAYCLIVGFSIQAGIEPILVLRDLLQTCEKPPGVGMVSNIGILLWATAAAISSFTCLSGLVVDRRSNQLLVIGSIFSTLLCLDDLFLLHDRYLGQDFLYISYALLALFLLLRFRNLLLRIDKIAFLAASLLLGLSILSDKVQIALPISYEIVQLFEEGFKFIGIACWVRFWWKASLFGLKSSTKS